jgi:phospholipase/carboxylesterase
LILLHGILSNEKYLFNFSGNFDPQTAIISVRAPFEVTTKQYKWYSAKRVDNQTIMNIEEAEQSRNLIIELTQKLQQEYKIPPQKTFLMGFSQGCIMALHTGLVFPQYFGGIIGIGGRLLAETKNQVSDNQSLNDLKIWLAHGTEDEVLPINNARLARDFIQTLACSLTYQEYPAKHLIYEPMIKDVNDWLSSI